MSHGNFCMLIICHLLHSMGNIGGALHDSIFLVLYVFCIFLYVVLPVVFSSWWHLILFVISILSRYQHFLCYAYLLLVSMLWVSAVFVDDWITSYVTANVAKHMLWRACGLAAYLSMILLAKTSSSSSCNCASCATLILVD